MAMVIGMVVTWLQSPKPSEIVNLTMLDTTESAMISKKEIPDWPVLSVTHSLLAKLLD
jgi:hypothetical protein